MVLINAGVVVHGHDLNVGHTQLLQVLQRRAATLIGGVFLSHAQILASPLLLNTGGSVDGHFTNVHLVNDGIGIIESLVGADILIPAFRVRRIHVDDHAPVTVDTGGLGIGVGGFAAVVREVHLIIVVGSIQVALNGHIPDALFTQGHGRGGDAVIRTPGTTLVQKHADTGSGGSPYLKGGTGLGPGCAQVIPIVGIVIGKTTGIEQTIGFDPHNGIALNSQVMQLVQSGLTAQGQRITIVIQRNLFNGDAGGTAGAGDHRERAGQSSGYRQRRLYPDIAGIVIHIGVGRLRHFNHVVAIYNASIGTAGFQEEVNRTGFHIGKINTPVPELLVGPVALADQIIQIGVGTAGQGECCGSALVIAVGF